MVTPPKRETVLKLTNKLDIRKLKQNNTANELKPNCMRAALSSINCKDPAKYWEKSTDAVYQVLEKLWARADVCTEISLMKMVMRCSNS